MEQLKDLSSLIPNSNYLYNSQNYYNSQSHDDFQKPDNYYNSYNQYSPNYTSTPKCEKPCAPTPKCEKPCAPTPKCELECIPVSCYQEQKCNINEKPYEWSWLGALILWFIIFTVLFWLIFYSLKPNFVLQTNSTTVDTSKVLLSAIISALILVIIIWLIKTAVSRKYKKC
jgi:hypothetical protein